MSAEKLSEHRISSADISVVIQGPLHRDHKKGDLAALCIASIRYFLPKAEILISTWHLQNTLGLDADKIIFSDEPFGIMDRNGNINNVVRQLVSTRNGIEAATRAYVLKFRADHQLKSNDFAVVREYPVNCSATNRLFQQPITVTNFFIRNPLRVPILFHLSDLVQFGRKNDMLDLWSIPLPEPKDICFDKKPKFRVLGNFVGYTSLVQVPEQTLMLGWLKKHGYSIHLPYICYTTFALFKLWERLLTDHFYVMNWNRAGIIFPERFHYSFYTKKANYLEEDLAKVRRSLASRFYFYRYTRLLLNKYIICWCNSSYLHSVASVLLYSLSPSFASKLRLFYKSLRVPR